MSRSSKFISNMLTISIGIFTDTEVQFIPLGPRPPVEIYAVDLGLAMTLCMFRAIFSKAAHILLRTTRPKLCVCIENLYANIQCTSVVVRIAFDWKHRSPSFRAVHWGKNWMINKKNDNSTVCMNFLYNPDFRTHAFQFVSVSWVKFNWNL